MVQNHVPHAIDTIVVSVATLATTVGAAILAYVPDVEPTSKDELLRLLLPLIGALIISGGMIMLNPSPETRRITIGRSIFALFFGVTLPQTIGLMHPSLEHIAMKPVILVLSGGILSALAFVLSKPFTKQMYERAEGVAKAKADELIARITNSPMDPASAATLKS